MTILTVVFQFFQEWPNLTGYGVPSSKHSWAFGNNPEIRLEEARPEDSVARGADVVLEAAQSMNSFHQLTNNGRAELHPDKASLERARMGSCLMQK